MAETTVRAVAAVLGLSRGDVVTIERTPFVEGAIAGGHLAEVQPEKWLPLPVGWRCPLCAIERSPDSDRCPNCTTTIAAEQGA